MFELVSTDQKSEPTDVTLVCCVYNGDCTYISNKVIRWKTEYSASCYVVWIIMWSMRYSSD